MKVIFKFAPLLWTGAAAWATALGACSDDPTGETGTPDAAVVTTPDAPAEAPDAPPQNFRVSDVPITGLPVNEVTGFIQGDDLFDLTFRPADGLGPVYVRASCGDCHSGGGRGPGLVQKMSIVLADGITASADQSALPYGHSIRPLLAAGATTPVLAPDLPNVKVSIRLGPPVLGRGYMEAVSDAEIERVAAEQAGRSDGIHGRPNHIGNGEIGRFGVKARLATLTEFAADAYLNDMGMTTPTRPTELPNPDGLTDDLRPGVDLDQDHVDGVAFYVRRIAIPARPAPDPTGSAAFATAQCSACHVPSLHTTAGGPVDLLSDIDAFIYSDLLLHDMGPALADGLAESEAGGSDFRTAPLIGLRFFRTYLHDGRALSVAEAIAAHDGEARPARDAFQALSAADQAALLQFVEAL